MEEFVSGDVVIVPFPFSDLSSIKLRPALVIAKLPGIDVILCQIASRFKSDHFSVPLTSSDFASDGLNQDSYVRPTRIFTSENSIIKYRAGIVKLEVLNEVRSKIMSILNDKL